MKPTPIPKSFASLLNPAFWSKISRITSLQYTWDILWMRKYFLVAVGSLESDLVMQTAIHHISAKKLWWLKEANLQVSFFFSDIIIFILLQQPIRKLRIWIFTIYLTNQNTFYKACLSFSLFVIVFCHKNQSDRLKNLWKFMNRRFGIGCWIRRARYLHVHQLLCSWW